MTLQIGNETFAKLYTAPFYPKTQNEKTVLSKNFFEETHFLVKTDKNAEKELTDAVKSCCNVGASNSESPASVGGFGLNGIKRILKDCLGIDIQGFPSVIDMLDSLANGLLTKLGDKAKEYVKTIKDGIAKLKESWSKSTNVKEGLHNFFNSLKLGAQMILNIPATIIGTLGEAGGNLIKKIFGEKVGNVIGQVINVVLSPLKFVMDMTFGVLAQVINHLIRKSHINEDVKKMVPDLLRKSVLQALRPLVNPILTACGGLPIPDQAPAPAKPKEKNFFEKFLHIISTPARKIKEGLDRRYQQALQKAMDKYMKENPQLCKDVTLNTINQLLDQLEGLITNKINTTCQERFNTLKNKFQNSLATQVNQIEPYFVDVRNIKGNPQRRDEILKFRNQIINEINDLAQMYDKCISIQEMLNDNQKQELAQMKQKIDMLKNKVDSYMKIVEKRYQH